MHYELTCHDTNINIDIPASMVIGAVCQGIITAEFSFTVPDIEIEGIPSNTSGQKHAIV